MASLSFNTTVNLTTLPSNPAPKYVGSLKIAQEPKGDVYQYYIVDRVTSDKKGAISNAGVVSFENPTKHMTSELVANIGVKSFPQLGAIGFYTKRDTLTSYMLLPIHSEVEKEAAPTLVVSQNAVTGAITFTITPPADTSYMCYRVIMKLNGSTYEHITYSTTLTVDAPYASGTYEIYCVGYVNEGEKVSADSTHQSVAITGSGVDPMDKFEYYTKLEIDAMFATLRPNATLQVTLSAANWTGTQAPYSQTVQLQGVVLSGYVYVVSPASADWARYCSSSIYMTEPTVANTITFIATGEKPVANLSVNVLKVGVT